MINMEINLFKTDELIKYFIVSVPVWRSRTFHRGFCATTWLDMCITYFD